MNRKKRKSAKRVERKISLSGEYAKTFAYLKESQRFIWVSVVLFFASLVIGYVFYAHFTGFDSVIKDLLQKTANLSGIKLILYIFWNNLEMSIIAIVLGLLLGIFPFIFNVYNGLVVGYVIRKVTDVAGIGEVWRLLPHGIFELPAIFIAFGIGIRLGWFINAKNVGNELKHRVLGSLRVLVYVILLLLIIAAIIEGTLITVYK